VASTTAQNSSFSRVTCASSNMSKVVRPELIPAGEHICVKSTLWNTTDLLIESRDPCRKHFGCLAFIDGESAGNTAFDLRTDDDNRGHGWIIGSLHIRL
jgi:hypothetical protein